MKKIRKLALFTFICVYLTSCGLGDADEDISEVNIAYFPNITHAQALVMKHNGMFDGVMRESGFTVNWIAFNAGPSEIEAMFAGAIDIGYIGPVPAVSGYIQSGGDIRIIAGASNGGSVLVAGSGSDIKSAADLDGKNVAIPQFGNTQHLNLLNLLSENDLAPSSSGGSVNVVAASNADIAGLMDRKNIDAAFVPEPWGSILELQHGAEVALDYDEVDPSGIPSTAVVIVRKDFLDSHRDIVEKFIKAHKEATLFISENDVKDIVNVQISEVTQSKIADDVLESAFRRLEIIYEIPEGSIMDFAKISLSENFISKLPDQDIVDYSFIK